VYPALSVLQAVADRAESVLWVGGKGGMEADLIARNHIPYAEIPAAGVHGVGLRSLPGNIAKLMQGVTHSRRLLREFQPDVMLFTGGYVAVPMAVAGIRINSLLYVPDIEPGMALKALARFSDVIALTAEESKRYFNPSKRLVVTGYPTRSTMKKLEKGAARKVFGLSSDMPVLLVIGGSKGARSINNAVIDHLPALLEKTQVIHVTGQLDWDEIQNKTRDLPSEHASRYRSFPFLHDEIDAAFSSADLCVSRAGASTLGELPMFGLPAVLVPYPYAWRYQKVNADYLVSKQAAVMVRNEDLAAKLLPTVTGLLKDRKKLSEMAVRMQSLDQPQAALKIADLLIELAEKNTAVRK